MKYASAQLIAILNGNSTFRMADLLTFTMWDGSINRWAIADTDLPLGGNTFTAGGTGTAPLIKRGGTRCVVGLEVDTLDLTLMCGQSVKMNGISMVRAAMNGAFDGARVKLERVFMLNWGDTTPGSVVLFEGNVAGVDPGSTQIKLQVKSELDRLNVAMPRYLYQPACGHTVYNAGCGLVKATWTVTGTATGTPTTTTIPSARAEATGYFNLGVLVMTSGASAGARRAVRSFAGGLFTLTLPLPAAPAPGDTFSVFPGCDRSLGAQGCTKFSNTPRFRGMPWVPRPETVR